MKYLNKLIVFPLIVLFCTSLLRTESLQAEIIKKEDYSIRSEIKYKQNLSIAALSFSGELKQERKYIRDLIRNAIIDSILLYRKFHFPSYVNYKRYSFNTSEKKSTGVSSNETYKRQADFDGFLEAKILRENDIIKLLTGIDQNDVGKIRNPELQEYLFVPGIDIIVSGEINQNRNNIEAKIKVINAIYKTVSLIKKSGTFKNINKLSDTISHEILKSIIVDYSYLNISCNKKESVIYIDDRFFGRTDKTGILLESGIHKIKITSENNYTKIFHVDLKEDKTRSLSVKFSDNNVHIAQSLKINTQPGNARAYLDSDFIGLTPVESTVKQGTYRLRVEKDGYITKFRTVVIGNKKNKKNEINIELEKGDTREYYFERTSAYNILFKCSLWGAALSSASYVFFGMKVEDENSRLRDMSTSDPDYAKIEDRRNNYKLYRQVSLYSIGAMIISTGIFYYLDTNQDDIVIAVHFPQLKFDNSHKPGNPPSVSMNNIFGLSITKSF